MGSRARPRSPTTFDRAGSIAAQRAYTASYGSSDLDAAVLLLPVLEFAPAVRPRVVDTVDAIRAQLGAGGPLLYRYPPGSDGLEGGEGAFLPCSFWLVQALALTGRRGEAEILFDELLALGGPLGLYSRRDGPGLRREPRELPASAHPRRCSSKPHSRSLMMARRPRPPDPR